MEDLHGRVGSVPGEEAAQREGEASQRGGRGGFHLGGSDGLETFCAGVGDPDRSQLKAALVSERFVPIVEHRVCDVGGLLQQPGGEASPLLRYLLDPLWVPHHAAADDKLLGQDHDLNLDPFHRLNAEPLVSGLDLGGLRAGKGAGQRADPEDLQVVPDEGDPVSPALPVGHVEHVLLLQGVLTEGLVQGFDDLSAHDPGDKTGEETVRDKR